MAKEESVRKNPSKRKTRATGTEKFTLSNKKTHWTVPDNVHVITLYGCSGGNGGQAGTISYGYQVPGPGGRGGDGSVPHYYLTAGTASIPVNEGDEFQVLVGTGGQNGLPGSPTVVTQILKESSAGPKRYIFDHNSGPITKGGDGAASGRDRSRSGGGTTDPKSTDTPPKPILGGLGRITFEGNQDNHWGGAGGGGGAGMAPGGNGGDGGCDGGSQIVYGEDFPSHHRGKPGQDGLGFGAGGGGGGGPGDGADGHVFHPGGAGGKGGDGYLEISY